MIIDWLEITPTKGDSGITPISVKVLEINEGLNRERKISGVNGTAEDIMTVWQEGKREPLVCTDGLVFDLNGKTINVLKNGIE